MTTTPDIASLRVLVVDDEPFVLNIAKRMLSRLGVSQIELASNGQEALDIVQGGSVPPDVIVCDLNMPDMDGIRLIRRLSEEQISSALLLVSGEDKRVLESVEGLARAHELQVLGAIEKPLKPDALERLLGLYQPSGPARRRIEPISEEELDQGLAYDEGVQVVFQPKVHVATRELIGVETLARWRHAERGVLGPAAFIPLAEETGRIGALTEAVFTRAMAQAGEWRADGLDLDVAVNASIDVLTTLDLPDRFLAWAEAEGFDPSKVTIEVTESKLMRDPRAPLEVLTRLALMGMSLSIDDFGTGSSSMEQLRRIPFGELKIDQQFVHGAADDRAARAILESSVSLGKTLGLKLVAEGVETQADWDRVEALGIDVVQGFFVAEPMNGDALIAWREQWMQGRTQASGAAPVVSVPPGDSADAGPLPRRLTVVLYADVAGYSRLTEADEDTTHRTLRAYLDLFADRIEAHHGRVAHYAGDAVLAEFSAVVDAVACANEVQREIAARNAPLPDERRVEFRIGVNLGDVISDRGDVYGDGVNVAARLEALAEPGGICVSDAVRSAIGTGLPLDYEFIGEHKVKNISEPVRAFHIISNKG